MPELAALTASLRAMLPASTGVGGSLAGNHPLWPGENVPGAVPRRLAEFAAGREAARLALADIGAAPMPIPMRRDRAPDWPVGLAGSITHADGLALAAVLRAPATIGIDLEPDADLPPDTFDLILTPAERGMFDLRAARAVFSAKETFFKAQYPRTGAMIGFDAVTVALSDDRFTVTLSIDLPGFPRGTALNGRVARTSGHVLTALVIT